MSSRKTLVGSHVSIAGGLHNAIERGESIDATAIQIFTKSNRLLFDKKIADEATEQFKTAVKKSTIESIIVHTGYLINIGSNKVDTAHSSTNALLEEVKRCESLDLKYLILHPGSHLGAGVEPCIKQIAKSLDYVLERSNGTVAILLETMAGQGTYIGRTFEELAQIRSLCVHKKNIGYCFDTCHVFCAGYDISTEDGYKKTFKSFDNILGLEHLQAIHLNDSETPLGSNKDRHAPLGTGHLKIELFKLIMNDKKLFNIPKVLETPSDADMKLWKQEIKLLRGLVD
jgi:deoxyribonuclease-4